MGVWEIRVKSAKCVGKTWEIDLKMMRKPLRRNDRNRKKVLSLVLCVAVMLSVMVLGAGAAFSDQDQIENTEAVNMCSALNIIGGYEDGSFHPERNIKRSEITKMICVALNGGKEPNLATPATPTFTDVRGTSDGWAEKYIESCVAQGIVSGVGGDRFSPAGNVTGSQLAKMLLVALGYDAELGQFTGTAWETNVNVVATQKGLYEGLETMDVSAAVTRDQAAQMVWNALQAVEVEYVYTLVSENGQLVSKVTVQDKAPAVVGQDEYSYTLLYDKYKALMTEDRYDTVTMTKYEWIDKDSEYKYTFAAPTTENQDNTITFISATDYTGLFAQQVNVVFKNDKDNSVYGIYAADSQVLYEGVFGDIEANDNDSIKIDGVKYKVDADNGLDGVAFYAENVYDDVTPTQDYYSIRVIDLDGDDEVDCVVYLPFSVAKVTYVGSKSITAGTTYTFEDNDIADGLAKDDFVMIVNANNTADDKNVITKIDTVEGTVDAKKNGTDLQINGTWYENANGCADGSDVGDTVALKVVGNYYFDVEVVEGKSLDNVLTVLRVNGFTSGLQDGAEAEVMYASTGDTATVKISEVGDVEVKGNAATTTTYTDDGKVRVGGMYTFVEKDGALELSHLSDNVIGAYQFEEGSAFVYDKDGLNAKDPSINTGTSAIAIADDAVVMVFSTNGNESAYISGKELKTWDDATWGTYGQVLTDTVNGIKTAKVISIRSTAELSSTSGSTGYGYVTGTTYYTEDADKTPYAVMDIWTADGQLTAVKAEKISDADSDAGSPVSHSTFVKPDKTNVTTNDATQKGAFVTFEKLSNGNITEVKAIGTPYALVGSYVNKDDETVLSLEADAYTGDSDATTSNITKDTVIIYVDTENKTGAEGGNLSLATETAIDGYYALNVVAQDNSGELDVLFVDVNNNLASNAGTFTTDVDSSLTGAAFGMKTGNTNKFYLGSATVAVANVKVAASAGTNEVAFVGALAVEVLQGTAASAVSTNLAAGNVIRVVAQDGTVTEYAVTTGTEPA